MKLLKTGRGKFLTALYYVFFLGADVLLMIFVMCKTGSVLAALGICFALGVGIGVLGGELEFLQHVKERRKKFGGKRKKEQPEKIVSFPVNS